MKKIIIIVLGAILLVLGIRAIIPSKDIDIHALHQYCKNNGYDTDHCILVDFSRPSGMNRFYIYSFREDKIIHKSICANGHGKEWNIFCRKFSNEPGSNYSSLGKYRVGKIRKMYSKPYWPGFVLYGLEKTNSNALDRGILIHRGNPPFQLYPLPAVPMSKGCFAVSQRMMKQLEEVQRASNKPLLLYAYK